MDSKNSIEETNGLAQRKALEMELLKLKEKNRQAFSIALKELCEKYECRLLPIAQMQIDGVVKHVAIKDILRQPIDIEIISL